MDNKRAQHHPAACQQCEQLPLAVYRRHWKHEPKAGSWHVIADGFDLMARVPRQAHFLTVLSYPERQSAQRPSAPAGPQPATGGN
jgi:hypothetical protein